MPPTKIIIYGNGEESELVLPEQYATRLKDEPLYRIIKDMNLDYDNYKEKQEKEKEVSISGS